MRTLRKLKPPDTAATTGSKNPFPRRVARMLNTTAGSPRLTKPSKKPLLLGMILQGPDLRNLAMPNPPLAIEVANVRKNIASRPLLFDTPRHRRM